MLKEMCGIVTIIVVIGNVQVGYVGNVQGNVGCVVG